MPHQRTATADYSSVPNRSPGHFYNFLVIFLPGHPLLRTGYLSIFDIFQTNKSIHNKSIRKDLKGAKMG